MVSPWDPDRLQNIGWLLSRYGEHIAPGDRVRRYVEGDPVAAQYRGADDAEVVGTVMDVTRTEDGHMTMRVEFDDGTTDTLDNSNVAWDRVWELHESSEPTFRARLAGDEVRETTNDEPTTLDNDSDGDRNFRSAVTSQVEALEKRMAQVEEVKYELEKTMAELARHLSSDLLRTYRGEEPVFAGRYSDRYDQALQGDEYAGTVDSEQTSERKSRAAQRHDFDLTDGQGSVTELQWEERLA